jgi:class 3 adenylate cyclase/tetratricopeptide (TPR) repeat protein
VRQAPDRTPATAPIAERRVTSVLFADLVGFTPLSERRDPEEVRELLSRYFAECRTVIGRYGGAVEKFIGDAVMAVWGVPAAHEDDAERAVRAGLELVATVANLGQDVGAPGLALRVGIVTGEVAVTVGATAEGMVAGDAVNTAARVQSAAEPGQVWVDDTTRSLSAASIAYTEAGVHSLKGKSEPMRLHAARAVLTTLGGAQRLDGLEAPHMGRDPEMRLLKELFHAAVETHRPKLVVVDGVAGIGKSRLLWEFFKYVDGLSEATLWHRGRCLSYGDGVAFWALAEAARTRLGLAESDAGEVVRTRLDDGLAEFVPDPDERAWIRPRLAVLVGAEVASDFDREELFAAWTAFFERVAQGSDLGLVLVLDDAQFADEGLLDFIDQMMASAQAGLFVVALARPELMARRHDLGGRSKTVIRLEPLVDADMARLVDGLVVGLPQAARDSLVRRAEGVPLFAVETVRALIDRDMVIPMEGQYVPAPGVSLDVETMGAPASLQALVAARLDALSPDERQVVADACILGVSFTRAGLAALSRGGDLDPILASLQRKDIIGVQTDRYSGERGQFRFLQTVVRQVAYATLSRRDRKERHLAAAAFLAAQIEDHDDFAVVVAQHLLDAVDCAPEGDADVVPATRRAVALLERAATRAATLGGPVEAERLLESALARCDDPHDRARISLAAAKAAHEAGEMEVSIRHGEVALALNDTLGAPIDAGVAAAWVARGMLLLQAAARARDLAEPRWLALRDVEGADRALLPLATALAEAHRTLGDVQAMAVYNDHRLQLAEGLGDQDALAHAQMGLALRLAALGATQTAMALFASAAGIARENNNQARHSQALSNTVTFQMSWDLQGALETSAQAFEAARRSGTSLWLDFARRNRVLALWRAGQLVEASELLGEFAASARDQGFASFVPAMATWLGEALGAELGINGDGPSEPTDNAWARAWWDYHDMKRAARAGRFPRAVDLAERSLAGVLTIGIAADLAHLWPGIVGTALAAGDLERAARFLLPVANAPRGFLSPVLSAHLANLRGLVGAARGDQPDAVEADLRAGASGLEEFGAVGLAARAKEDLARWLEDHGRGDEATGLLEQARATYQEIGALGWLTGLDAQLPSGVGAGAGAVRSAAAGTEGPVLREL